MAEQKIVEPIKKITNAAIQSVRAESASPPERRNRTWLFRIALVLIAFTFAGLTFLVETTPSFGIDLQITQAIQRINLPPFMVLMSLASWPGFSPQSMILTGLIVLLIYISGLHWEAVMAVMATIISTAINLFVKDLIQRPRPLPGQVNVLDILNSYSFPSGHVMFYLVFYGFLVFLTFSILKSSLKRSLILTFFLILIVLVGPSRIYLGDHWASDVLGSYLLGSLTLVATIQLYLWGKTRFFVHQPVAPVESKQV